MEELIDVLDENGNKTGEVATRKEVHKKGLWHGAIVAAIINDKNEILMQQRSYKKEKNAGMWDISVAGHISSEQTPNSATIREIKEEVDVDCGETELKHILKYRDQRIIRPDFIENQFYDFYILRKEGLRIENITVQKSEVEQAKFVTISELSDMLSQRQVVERNIMYRELKRYFSRELGIDIDEEEQER